MSWDPLEGHCIGFAILLLVGELLLEHSGVEQFVPLLATCSTMPSLVDADIEGMNVTGNSSYPGVLRTCSNGSLSDE